MKAQRRRRWSSAEKAALVLRTYEPVTAMGLARSHVRDLLGRADDWTDGRIHRTPHGDDTILAELRKEIVDLPSYGCRRACALVNRQRAARSDTQVNPRHVYRVMAQAGLLLPKAPRRRQSTRTQ